MNISLEFIYSANGVFFSLLFISLSIWVVSLIIYRGLRNVFLKTRGLDDLMDRLEAELEQNGAQSARAVCEEDGGVYTTLFTTAMDNAQRSKVAARDAIAHEIEQFIYPALTTTLPWILFVAKVAPMVGLLGTVAGMIAAFGDIADAGAKVDPSVLARSIGMALFTTFEGLVIAIMALSWYTYFRQGVQTCERELQRGAQVALEWLPRLK